MHRFVTCPHCAKHFHIEYLVRRHPVNVVTEVRCLGCRQPIPNPGPPSECTSGFVVCRLSAEEPEGPSLSALGAGGALLLRGLRWLSERRAVQWLGTVLRTRGVGWLLCVALLALLVCGDLLGVRSADGAFVGCLAALPFATLSVTGVGRIRNQVGPEVADVAALVFEALGFLAAGLVLVVLICTVV